MYNIHVLSCNIALECPTQQFRHIPHPHPLGPAWELMLCRKFDIALMQSIHRNFKTKNARLLRNEYWHQHSCWPHDQNCKVDQVVLVGFLFYSECLKWSSSEIVRLSKTHKHKFFSFSRQDWNVLFFVLPHPPIPLPPKEVRRRWPPAFWLILKGDGRMDGCIAGFIIGYKWHRSSD